MTLGRWPLPKYSGPDGGGGGGGAPATVSVPHVLPVSEQYTRPERVSIVVVPGPMAVATAPCPCVTVATAWLALNQVASGGRYAWSVATLVAGVLPVRPPTAHSRELKIASPNWLRGCARQPMERSN